MGSPQRQWLDERSYLEREAAATMRHEYAEGMAYEKAGANERHCRIVGNLLEILHGAARGTGCGVYISDMKLRIGGGPAYYYPDVMLSCEPSAPDTVFKESPCLVAEVLSPSTAGIDTREKLQAYRGIASLRYYLLVDADRCAVSYHVRGKDGEWLAATLDPGERIDIECGPVRSSFGLSELYEDTGLAAA